MIIEIKYRRTLQRLQCKFNNNYKDDDDEFNSKIININKFRLEIRHSEKERTKKSKERIGRNFFQCQC